MRVAVIGASGQLGRELVTTLGRADDPVPLDHAAIEVSDRDSVARALGGLQCDWVVNTAAFHHVERCQEEVEQALRVNALGASHVARVARDAGASVLFVSTDYVFGGTGREPLSEHACPAPVNVYGASKLAGEALVRAAHPEALIVRTCGLFGVHPCRAKGGQSFIDRMLALGRERGRVRVVDDEWVSPTWTGHLASWMVRAMREGASGLVHAAGQGVCTWYELARAAFAEAGLGAEVERAAPGEFPGKAPRPVYSGLTSVRCAELGLPPLPPWQEGLRAYLRRTSEVQR